MHGTPKPPHRWLPRRELEEAMRDEEKYFDEEDDDEYENEDKDI